MGRAYVSNKRLGLPKGQWHPQLVGVVRGYPKTYEIWKAKSDLMRQQVRLYNAEGITFRNGVPDGWAGKKALINEINEKAQAEAKVIVADLIKRGKFEPDNDESATVIEEAMKIIVAEKHTPETEPVPLYNVKDRLAAMKLVLDKVQKSPVSRNENTYNKAEDFLKALAED